ncbi:carbon catabolite repressor protein 4 homolog 6 isoform X3 [Rhododendron vialii]|uniref:carbon catabolite repressor protein 4 homolog 6 isoform X3 n=1 Tax=Rhododendron vialii TaxID=182163 RepID=UPI00266026BD|nr:carbon catabolite repressor protein 4 homolog 6 isoform X3 [Rhododendron vialii]
MKRPSAPSLQLLAAAESSAVMSSRRPAYRGIQYQIRRGVSDQSYSSSRGQFVTGDSHFQSVSDANRGFRPVEDAPNFHNQYWPCNTPPHFYPPPYSHPPPPPPFNTPPSSNPHPPPFNRGFRPPQQFWPRPPKPLDYRNWEYPKLRPPPHCERFKVLSYNILADYLANNHRSKLYFHIPPKMLEWEWRKRNIIFELGLWSADILCFQEIDKFQDLEEELKLRGYSGIWKVRTGAPVDGCAIFWRVSRFKLLHEECIEFNKLGLRDNVAQICVLESLNQNNTKDMPALPSSLGCFWIELMLFLSFGMMLQLSFLEILTVPQRQSPLYNYIAEQKLNLSDLPRDKLSGQASAEIHPPMQVSLGIRAQQADSRGGALLVVDPRELSRSGSPLVVQQQSRPERKSVNLPSVNSLSQPQCVRTGSNLYASNPNSGRCGNEEVDSYKDETPDGGLRESLCSSQNNVGVFVEQMKKTHSENICSNSIGTELIKETCQDTLDGCNNVFHSLVSIGGLKDTAISPRNEGKVSGALRKDAYEFTSVDSRHEDLTVAEHEKQMQAPINAQFDSFIEPSEPILKTENRISSCEKSKLSSLSSNDNTDAITDPTPSGISSTEISSSSTVEVSATGSSESFSSLLDAKDKDNPSNFSKVNVSRELTSTDYMIGGKMENLPLEDLPETDAGDKVFDEDSTKFLSELCDGNESFSSNISHAVRSDLVESDESFRKTEPDNALNFRYDPSAWTPMEIETATGNADCTFVEHPLKLRSTYAEVEDCSGTRDSNGEPLVTSYNRGFLGTVDYIWRSEGLQTVGVLAPIPKHAMQWTPGFPTKKWGSDHIALVSELAFVKDGSIQKS